MFSATFVHADDISTEEKYQKLLEYGAPKKYLDIIKDSKQLQEDYDDIFVNGQKIFYEEESEETQVIYDDTKTRSRIEPGVLALYSLSRTLCYRNDDPNATTYQISIKKFIGQWR